MPTSDDVTGKLRKWKIDGDHQAERDLFELVENELVKTARRMLREESGFAHKVDPRELVNEAYLALRDYPIATQNRAPFFALMARAMRHFLIDLARRQRAAKRPQTHLKVVDTNVLAAIETESQIEPIEFYESLDALRAISARQADTIELKVLGLSNQEIAAEQGVSVGTVQRDVAEARAFLAFRLGLSPGWVDL